MSKEQNNSAEKAPKENVTYRLLELLEDDDRASTVEVDEPIHVDERWLMSYADKMTLLCGCFIMLFAISTLDPVKLQQVQESAQKSFGKPTAVVPKPVVSVEDVKRIQEQQKIQEEEIQRLQAQKDELEKTLSTVSKDEDKRKVLTERLQKVLEERSKLETKSRVLETRVKTLTAEVRTLKSQVVDPKQSQKEIEKLRVTLNSTQTQLQVTEKTVTELKAELEEAKGALVASGFVAFVMSWDTRDHDVDLVVEDPNKRSFDFKKRSHKSHPGLLVLDTRQGPGVEIWQADKIIPGVYTFNYLFYNSYGNPKPCTLTGTLFTSKGAIKMPSVTLDTTKNKSIKLRVSISEDGKAKLLN